MHEPDASPMTPSVARDSSLAAKANPRGRTPIRAALQLIRRSHLYAGLFMLPWTMVYAVSAVLFNHPQLYQDRIEANFGKDALAGTPMESPPAPTDLAKQVIAALRERNPGASYALIEPEKVRYTAVDSAVVKVQADGQDITLLVNLTGKGGYIRLQPTPPPKPAEEKAPFAVGRAGKNDMRERRPEGRPAPAPRGGDAVRLAPPLEDRVKATVPQLLEKHGFPQGKVSVTFMPDLTFLMMADGKIWKVKYHFQTGSVSGGSPDADVPTAKLLSTGQFLTRMHLASGYPSEVNLRWWWAGIVDAMAGIMVFWGFSGLLMWWQIKRTRRLGIIVLILSLVVAIWVGVGMHNQMTMPKQ
jgi:hypothetical protein